MSKKRTFSQLLIPGIFACLGTAAAAQTKTTISFQLTAYNNIIVPAVLNKQDTLRLMLHTASADVNIKEDVAAKLKTFKPDGSVDSVKSWGDNNNSAGYSKNNTLQIGNLDWNGLTIWTDVNTGQQSDGKFGLNLFKEKFVKVDFDKNQLIISKKLPRHLRRYKKFKLIFRNDELFIEGVCKAGEQIDSNLFLIHSGYAGDILLDDAFAGKNKIAEKLKIVGEKKLRDAYGNTITTQKAIMPVFQIGDAKLTDIPVSFFAGNIGRQKMSIIGGDILKRFNWVIDAKREYIYLMPNHLFDSPYTNI